jgi:UTP--glucose-1-phosphate uridylyltransferase
MKINKALITAAGYGTRFFPTTKTIQKEMLPLLNRPLIDYVVDDCIKAGIEEIIFVVKPNDTQIIHYYSENQDIYDYLKRMNKLDKYPDIEKLHTKVKVKFVYQDPNQVYGTATPLKLAQKYLEQEDAFLVFMGDDYIYNTDGSSEAQKMIDLFIKNKAQGLATFIAKPKELLNKYGVLKYRLENNVKIFEEIVEKPELGSEPSNLANISKYIFTPGIFDSLKIQKINEIHNELLITDTLSHFAKENNVIAYETKGEYLDSGYILGWLKANIFMAMQDPTFSDELKNYINSL